MFKGKISASSLYHFTKDLYVFVIMAIRLVNKAY